MKIRLSGIIALIMVVAIVFGALHLPYCEYFPSRTDKETHMIEHLISPKNNFSFMLALVLFYPLLMALEATIFYKKKTLLTRLLFLIQTMVLISGYIYASFAMSWAGGWAGGKSGVTFSYYLIQGYIILGALWNLLLIIPYFDQSKVISKPFHNLSLLKDKGTI
jgi:hypothetical protein